MGLRIFWCLFICLCALRFVISVSETFSTICDVPGCNCTRKAAPWNTVNCTFKNDQDVSFGSNQIESHSVEIFITGGNLLTFSKDSFNSLPGLAILYVGGTHKVVIEPHSFSNVTSSSLLIKIENCDELTIKTAAFQDVQSPLTCEIDRTNSCLLESAVFHKLMKAKFEGVRHLKLMEGSFKFQPSHSRHGPATIISFKDVRLPRIPPLTFTSSMAELQILDSEVYEIEPQAIKLNEISAVSIVNCTIETIKSNAFTDYSLIINMKISTCKITKLEPRAFVAAMTNLTIQHSRLADIETGAINATAASVDIIGNEIQNFANSAFVFKQSNRIIIHQNIIRRLGTQFVEAHPVVNRVEFKFTANEIHHANPGALQFVPEFFYRGLIFDNNLFNETCSCIISEWVETLTNEVDAVDIVLETSYCFVSIHAAKCFNLTEGVIKITNFSDLVCDRNVTCQILKNTIEQISVTDKIYPEEFNDHNSSWLILTLTFIGLFIIAIVATFVFLLISGGRWLKRKGYFRNIHYNQNEQSTDEENTTVTMDESEKLTMPEELTIEFLELLKQRLDDPALHQETSEMIEKLYEMFIVEDNYENNNKDEEAHLYEELGNLQLPPPLTESDMNLTNGPRSILKLVEEKFNQLQYIDHEDVNTVNRPTLANDYSEPTDTAVHLYSEVKQNKSENDENESKSSLKSDSSRNMASRPLPRKPVEDKYLGASSSTKID